MQVNATLTVPVNLDYDTSRRVTQETLFGAIKDIETLCDPSDIDDYDTLNETLSMFSTVEEMEMLSVRDVPNAWSETVLTASA